MKAVAETLDTIGDGTELTAASLTISNPSAPGGVFTRAPLSSGLSFLGAIGAVMFDILGTARHGPERKPIRFLRLTPCWRIKSSPSIGGST